MRPAALLARPVTLRQWQANLKGLADLYAQGQLALSPTFVVQTDMLDGLEFPQAPGPFLSAGGSGDPEFLAA